VARIASSKVGRRTGPTHQALFSDGSLDKVLNVSNPPLQMINSTTNIQNLNLNINFKGKELGSQEFDKEFSPAALHNLNNLSANVSVNLDSKNI
jgi:hypothetical protein